MRFLIWILFRPPIVEDRRGREWAFVVHDELDSYPLDGGAVCRKTEAPNMNRPSRLRVILRMS